VVVPHPIQQNKVERTNVGNVVGFIRSGGLHKKKDCPNPP